MFTLGSSYMSTSFSDKIKKKWPSNFKVSTVDGKYPDHLRPVAFPTVYDLVYTSSVFFRISEPSK